MPKTGNRKSRRAWPPRPVMTRGEADRLLMRLMVRFTGGWEECMPACRRAGRCASPEVACFDRHIDRIRDTFEAAAAWQRLDGPREPEELAQPVTEFFD